MGDQSGHNTNVLISEHSSVWRMILDHYASMFYSGSLFNFLAKKMIFRSIYCMDHLSRFWAGNAGMYQHYHDLVDFPMPHLFSRTKEYKPRLQYPKKLHSTVLLVVKNHRLVTVNGIVIYCIYIYV